MFYNSKIEKKLLKYIHENKLKKYNFQIPLGISLQKFTHFLF